MRQRASRLLEIIDTDAIGPTSPPSYPKEYRFVGIFIDDFSRLAMSYSMKIKNEVRQCLETFAKMTRKVLDRDEKVYHMRCDQAEEYMGGYTRDVLEHWGAKLQPA